MLLMMALVLAGILIIVFTFVKTFTIAGDSMLPVLQNQDRVIVISHWPTKWLCKGMIVVVKSPIYFDIKNKHASILLVKRIVGLPSDIVFTTNLADGSQLLGKVNEDFYVDVGTTRIWRIQPRYFFLRGDSYGTDSDSLGPLPYDSLIGIVVLRLWNNSHGK